MGQEDHTILTSLGMEDLIEAIRQELTVEELNISRSTGLKVKREVLSNTTGTFFDRDRVHVLTAKRIRNSSEEDPMI